MKQFKKVVLGLVSAGLVAAATLVFADNSADAIAERLAPVGKVCMAGDDCAGGTSMVAAGEARTGEEIVQTKCFACHGSGVGGAPKIGDAEAWKPRVAQGMDVMFEKGWNGFNAMPAKGICMDCSEDEFRSAIQYMVDGAQ